MGKRIIAALVLSAVVAGTYSCGKKTGQEEVAKVNGSSIHLKEFEKELALASRRDPNLAMDDKAVEEVLNTMVDRKLLIQEAVKKGLSKDERFLDAIKTFWEQTLVRELIEVKEKEWAEKISVTDEEVMNYHARMAFRVTLKAASAKDEAEAVKFKERLYKGDDADIKGVETMTILAENIKTIDPLYGAFGLNEGEASALKSGKSAIAVKVIKKEPLKAPPLQEIAPRIKAKLLGEKKEAALEQWLDSIKASARIEIDKNKLARAAR